MKETFVDIFGSLEDPRVERTKKHQLIDVIGLAILSVIAGAQSFSEIEDFGHTHHDWFKNYFSLENGIPSHDTFERVFSRLEPDAFQKAWLSWIKEVKALLPEHVIAIDGKTMCGSHQRKKGLSGLHIVSAWSCENELSLGQIKVADKSNEITAIPLLLEQIGLEGAIVTLDAMGCQRAIAEKIHTLGGDYILTVKGNQGSLEDALEDTIEKVINQPENARLCYEAVDEIEFSHGRIEARECTVLPAMYKIPLSSKWKGIASLIKLTATRDINNVISKETRYFISSLNPKEPQKILNAIRAHWHIENKLHWMLDVVFREDDCRVRNEKAALNLAWVRKMALAALKKESSFKASIRRKQLKAWASPDYLINIMEQF
jgi:predicted transposase YbfD/YdcC